MKSTPIACECASCISEDRREENTERMWAAPVVAVCVRCGKSEGTTVKHLIQCRQVFLCTKHRGVRGKK